MQDSQESTRDDAPFSRNSRRSLRRRGFSPAVRFVVFFVITLAVLGFAYAHVTAKYHDDLEWLLRFTAAATGWGAMVFSGDVSVNGTGLSYKGFSVEIIDECTGLLEMVIYLAAVVAFSTTIRKKAIGVLIGVPAIYLFNIIRIVVLLIAGASSQELFKFFHLYFWQATLIIMIGTVWVGWLYLVVFREEKRPMAVST